MFEKPEPGLARIVVAHHPFATPSDSFGGVRLRGAAKAMAAFAELGVDLVLGGHLHRAYTADSRDLGGRNAALRSVRVVQCGTTTSLRGRGREAGRQSLNLIEIEDDVVRVTVYEYHPLDKRFAPARDEAYQRSSDVCAPLDGMRASTLGE
jgi:3',5'-cyclic AMP phosphodiesterase CpdA